MILSFINYKILNVSSINKLIVIYYNEKNKDLSIINEGLKYNWVILPI